MRTITLCEEQRQLTIMALAHLAVARPGWDYALSDIASLMDQPGDDGRPQMFTDFKRIDYRHLSRLSGLVEHLVSPRMRPSSTHECGSPTPLDGGVCA